MKAFFLAVLLFANLLYAASDEKQSVSIGFGPYIQSQPYTSTDNLILPSPVIFFDNSLFYVRWSRFGIYFLGDKNEKFSWGFSLTAQPRTLGYKPSDADILSGMKEKKSSFEGGIAFSLQYKDIFFEQMVLNDILGYHKGWLSSTELGTEFSIGEITFYPSVTMLYFSDTVMDYYYGVNANETTLNRPLYKADAAFEFGAQTYISFPIYDSFSALFNLRYDYLPQSAKDSPLVEEHYIYSGLASVLYNFEY